MFEPLILTHKQLFKSTDIINLLDGKISCIIIDNFYPSDACEKLSKFLQTKSQLFKRYSNIDAKVLGNPLFWDGISLDEYLDATEMCKNQLSNMYRYLEIENPMDLVINTFNSIWNSGALIPIQSGKSYYAGDIRVINYAGLHTDIVTRNIKLGILSEIQKQMSWNIYLTEPGKTHGALEIFDKEFEESDIKFKRKNGFGYKMQLIEKSPKCVINPKLGRFVLIKSSNYHKIIRNPKGNIQRLTITSFIGFLGQNKPLIFWS